MFNTTSSKNLVKQILLLGSFCSSLLFLGCGDDDAITLATCSDGGTYALDYRPLFFQDTRIWLTAANGDVGFDEPLDNLTFGIQFLNFEDACEDEYTVSFASYLQGGGSSPTLIAENLFVNEYAQVPSGSVLDQSTSRTSNGIVNFQPESSIVITDCPPIDSIRFWLNSVPFVGQENNPPYEYEYFPDENVLIITTQAAQVTSTDAIMAIRTEQEGNWHGLPIDLLTSQLTRNVSFSTLQPLALQSTTVAWPTDISFAELEIQWINSITGQRSTIIGRQIGAANMLTALLPPDAVGPFLITANWTDENRYESAQVFEEWPTQVVISSQIDAQVEQYTYPTMELTATGADIVEINGIYTRTEVPELCFRDYISPLTEGPQTLRFPSFSPRLRDDRLDRIYEGALQENVTMNFFHYPAMNGSYLWYLRNVRSQQGTGLTWLQSLEYEQLVFPL
ncbi:MAG: hypothetical protein AAFZ63_28325 [Bacteroidota bacterium]